MHILCTGPWPALVEATMTVHLVDIRIMFVFFTKRRMDYFKYVVYVMDVH